ncbi:hypothetical protein E2E30_09505 [Sphingomonas sp. AAP5]|uniref:hypothetical protein n=1 Tax=Sphingomonas sp. AAP5 TaxID=1523415 RepID=UPI0010574845|nr:hypothetical protein [Sphingomonas sp. AAP5]QBM75975.1 hypothetical protein E2E30_09505 [Sphingomonas sp. AAP5]
MREPLTLARFQELADAYGGVIARWPEEHRDAAMALAVQPAARHVLADAFALDAELDTWRVSPAALSLRARVIADAPAPTRKIAGRAKLWWSGVGIAAALAGATAGTAAVAFVAPPDTPSDSGTSFGDVAGSES